MRSAAAIACALMAASALGQELHDPTRPAGVAGVVPEEGESRSGPVLQSVLISPARKLAIIDGRMVELGARVGEATVYAISETGVVLKQGDDLRTLALLPEINKKPVRSGRREERTPR